ncbi:MAG TPA: tRNA lysidine(34) synthetase TilS [Candidatus Limnocylindria bacterium]|nr:tRNA lysidine(34) synthetase TilS [Candidatus Limnocylindria bacterium]
MGSDPRPVVVRRVASFLGGAPGIPPGSHVLVACSGGPDSSALALALGELGSAHGLRLTLAYLRHGVRVAADEAQDEAVVRAIGERLQAPVYVRALGVSHGPGVESRARELRRAALGALADEVGASHIALGHTLDDQAETLLLRLLRGGGRGGLAGMRAYAGRVVRPLLGVSRADVRWYLAERRLVPALDRTNADLQHARNRVRRLVLPLLAAEFNPRVTHALAGLASRLRDEDDVLQALARSEMARLCRGTALDCAVAALPPALGRRVVRAWLGEQGLRGLTAGHVERVRASAARPPRGALALPGGLCVWREGDWLVCGSAAPDAANGAGGEAVAVVPGGTARGSSWVLAVSVPQDWTAGTDPWRPPDRAVLDADTLPGPLSVRAPRRGDRVRIPKVGTRKLHDVLIDRKVPRGRRAALPVLLAGDDVVWVPGVVRAAVARVDASTRRVLEASVHMTDKPALPLAKPCGTLSPRVERPERGTIE